MKDCCDELHIVNFFGQDISYMMMEQITMSLVAAMFLVIVITLSIIAIKVVNVILKKVLNSRTS